MYCISAANVLLHIVLMYLIIFLGEIFTNPIPDLLLVFL